MTPFLLGIKEGGNPGSFLILYPPSTVRCMSAP
uniref:Uncharacterized protein n=1 Tax=Anguilla anguilla TaxID=7936 RepID=A0A0E9Q3A9_ANGAN